MATQPHEREALAITKILMELYPQEDGAKTYYILAENFNITQSIFSMARQAIINTGIECNIHRNVIEFPNGSTIRFESLNNSSALAGNRPDKVFIFGPIGEFFYWLKASGAEYHFIT